MRERERMVEIHKSACVTNIIKRDPYISISIKVGNARNICSYIYYIYRERIVESYMSVCV